MTIGIGLRTPTGVVLGCDSAGTADGTVFYGTEKMFDFGHFTLVIAGSYRLKTLFHLNRKEWSRYRDPHRLAQLLREAIRKDDWTLAEDRTGGPKTFGASILLARKDGKGLWQVDSDGAAEEIRPGFYVAIGSGTDYAMGALAALHDQSMPPTQRVMRALRASVKHNAYCGGELKVRCFDGRN